MWPYSPKVEQSMKTMYHSLREKDQRRYAAVEAAKLGHGGIDYISKLLGCDPKTIHQGLVDLSCVEMRKRKVIAKAGCHLDFRPCELGLQRAERPRDDIIHIDLLHPQFARRRKFREPCDYRVGAPHRFLQLAKNRLATSG